MKKYIAELFGTFVLVFVGCGTVVFSAPYVGNLGIALAFGLAVTAMVYCVGPISGAHLNPAVTLGVLTAGRMNVKSAFGYVIVQFIGATAAAALLKYMVAGHISGYDIALNGLGQNGWGVAYAGGYNLTTAIIFEFVATFIFVKTILKVTEADLKIAGVVIGLTLAVIHILGLPITGVSVNPARSFGPAFIVCGQAFAQVWMFLLVPSLAGIVAGLASRCCCCGSCQIKQEKKEVPAKTPAVAHHHASAHRNDGRRGPARGRRPAAKA